MDQTKVFRGYSPFGFMHLDWSSTKEHLQILLNADDSNAQTLNAELLSFVAAPFQPARLARISSAGKQRSSDSRPIAIPSLVYSEIFSTFSFGIFFGDNYIQCHSRAAAAGTILGTWGAASLEDLQLFAGNLPCQSWLCLSVYICVQEKQYVLKAVIARLVRAIRLRRAEGLRGDHRKTRGGRPSQNEGGKFHAS
jgi:hypothetical protein